MQKNWLHVPMEISCGYRQILTKPNTEDQFLTVQPECKRNSNVSKKMLEGQFNEKFDLEIVDGDDSDSINEYSIISHW